MVVDVFFKLAGSPSSGRIICVNREMHLSFNPNPTISTNHPVSNPLPLRDLIVGNQFLLHEIDIFFNRFRFRLDLKSFQIGYVTLSNTLKIKSKTNCLASARTLRRQEKVWRIQSPDAYLPSG